MKRIICVLTLAGLFLMSNQTYAQLRVSLGPKLGLNFGTVSYDPDVTTKSGRTAMMFGAAFELSFGKMFAVQVEPGYAMKGNTFDNVPVTDANNQPIQGASENATLSINEIQFPILFKVKFLEGQVRPYALVGPNLGIVASAKITSISFTGLPQGLTGNTDDIDVKSTTSSLDFGLDFGGGAEFMVTPRVGITGDVRYSLGLSNIYNAPANAIAAQAQTTPSRKTRGFQLQFGALFQI